MLWTTQKEEDDTFNWSAQTLASRLQNMVSDPFQVPILLIFCVVTRSSPYDFIEAWNSG